MTASLTLAIASRTSVTFCKVSSEQYRATRSPEPLMSLTSCFSAVVLPLCRGAWTTKYSPLRMSEGTSGRRAVAGSM